MNEQSRTSGWVPWAVAAVLAAIVGVVAYNLGLDRAASAAPIAEGRYWHGGFFPFGLLFLFWIGAFLLRGLFWGRCWGPRFRGRYYDAWYDDPARWDEWHRRAHEHMNTPGPSART
jgi:hypothetical protein